MKNMYTCEKVYDFIKDKHSYHYIDTLNLNSLGIESIYQMDELDVMGKPRNEEVEHSINIKPSFVAYFYFYIERKRKIPTQKEYITFYWLENKDWIYDNLNEAQRIGLFGRLSRFYPSMLRDFHFYHVLKESGKYERVYYNIEYDIEYKIDILVKKNGKWYGLQLRTKTRNSDYFYEKKKKRKVKEKEIPLIDVPIELSKAKSIHTKKNSLKLYGQSEIAYIEAKIKEQEGGVLNE